MGFSKEEPTQMPESFLLISIVKNSISFDIKAVVCMEEVHDQLVIALIGQWKCGTKSVKIVSIIDHYRCWDGNILPLQLILTGTTQRCLPKVDFPSNWYITCTKNQWSNEITMVQYNIDRIWYHTTCMYRNPIPPDHPALAIFDVFKGQCVESLHILYVLVPANCTDNVLT